MDTIESLIEEWERKYGRDARRQQLIDAVRTATKGPPNSDASKLMDAALRQADDEALKWMWQEWRGLDRPDIKLRLQQELERRKRRNCLNR